MRRTNPISFRIRADIKEALELFAKQDKRTLSAYVEIALEEHIQARKQQGGGKKGKR